MLGARLRKGTRRCAGGIWGFFYVLFLASGSRVGIITKLIICGFLIKERCVSVVCKDSGAMGPGGGLQRLFLSLGATFMYMEVASVLVIYL